jgi:hypothetical protein
LGLANALKSAAGEFARDSGIRCEFKTNAGKVRFDPRAAVAVFRIVQAALTNAARHAHASSAVITLMRSKTGLNLTVMDNGKGIAKRLTACRDPRESSRHYPTGTTSAIASATLPTAGAFGEIPGIRPLQDVVDFGLKRPAVRLCGRLELLQDIVIKIADQHIRHRDTPVCYRRCGPCRS